MGNEDNIILEIRFEKKTAKGLEDHTKILRKFIEQMKKTGFGGGSGGSGGGKVDTAQQERLEKIRHSNVMGELEVDKHNKDTNREKYDLNRREVQAIKSRDLQLAREVRVKDRMRSEETRHWNSIIERMVSGSMGTKAMGAGMMGIKGGIGAARGLGQLGMKGLGKTAKGQAIALQSNFAKEGDFNEGYGAFRSSGSVDQKDVKKERAKIQGNKLANAFTKTLSRTKAFGDKMGMSGKTGKALGIAGIGAMGIVGGVITKAIESSPIAQAMMKMMSTAFTLILRPIGDFFGGFMKPIAVRLLKFGAENVKNFANIHKMGEKVGIAALALFTKPAEVIGLIAERIGGTIAIALNPLMDDAKKALAYGKLFNGFDDKMEVLAGQVGEIASFSTQASQQVQSGLTTTNSIIQAAVEEVALISGATSAVLDKVDDVSSIVETMLKLDEQKNIIGTIPEDIKKAIGYDIASDDPRNSVNWKSPSGLTAREEMEMMSDTGSAGFVGGKSPEVLRAEELAAMNMDHSTTMEDMLKEYEEAELENYNKKIATNKVIIDKYTAETVALNTKTTAVVGQQHDSMMTQYGLFSSEKSSTYVDILGELTEFTDTMTTTQGDITDAFGSRISTEQGMASQIRGASFMMSLIISQAVDALKKMAGAMGVDGAGQGGSRSSGGSSSSGRRNRAHGGMINEHVIGVGQNTGSLWEFGERGLEYVTPATGSTSNAYDQTSNVTVNINVAKMTSDLDLQKIKPMVERALRETHSRRGII